MSVTASKLARSTNVPRPLRHREHHMGIADAPGWNGGLRVGARGSVSSGFRWDRCAQRTNRGEGFSRFLLEVLALINGTVTAILLPRDYPMRLRVHHDARLEAFGILPELGYLGPRKHVYPGTLFAGPGERKRDFRSVKTRPLTITL
jgi:hypothetical protein